MTWIDRAPRHRDGFSLIELLVVISIIAVLAGMLLPAVGVVRAVAKRSVCANAMRQMGMAFEVYAQDNDGQVPNTTVTAPVSTTGTYHWNDFIASYVDALKKDVTPDRAASQLRLANSVLSGCPEYKATSDWDLGIAMNTNLDRTLNQAYAQRGCNDTRAISDTNYGVYKAFNWNSLTHRGTRALLGDSTSHTMQTALAYVVQASRHQNKANVLFVDLHTQALAPNDYIQSLVAPDAASF